MRSTLNSDLKSIEILDILTRAKAGAMDYDARRDAAIMAIRESVRVRVEHNGIEFLADPEKLMQTVVPVGE